MARLIDADKLDIRDDNCGCAYDAKIIIKNAPTADGVEVVHGEWVMSEKHKPWYTCSVCHNCYVDGEWVGGNKWHYCPNCGAKMDKEVTV